jgi:hypothetical protein
MLISPLSLGLTMVLRDLRGLDGLLSSCDAAEGGRLGSLLGGGMAMDAAEAVRGIADFPAGAGRLDMATVR